MAWARCHHRWLQPPGTAPWAPSPGDAPPPGDGALPSAALGKPGWTLAGHLLPTAVVVAAGETKPPGLMVPQHFLGGLLRSESALGMGIPLLRSLHLTTTSCAHLTKTITSRHPHHFTLLPKVTILVSKSSEVTTAEQLLLWSGAPFFLLFQGGRREAGSRSVLNRVNWAVAVREIPLPGC